MAEHEGIRGINDCCDSVCLICFSVEEPGLLKMCLVNEIFLFELQDGCVRVSCVTLFLFQISYFPLSGTLR